MFHDITDRIAYNPPGSHGGVSVADVDGDGRFEFVVAGFGGPNRVLKWTGGRLRDVAPPELADPDRLTVAIVAADIDGDGREELYAVHEMARDRLWKHFPESGWNDLFARPENRPVRDNTPGRGVAALDPRGVGRYGFFVANAAGPARFYELGPDDLLAEVAVRFDQHGLTAGRGLTTAPLLSDRTDLFCVSDHGANFLYRNRGDGTFEEVAVGQGLADPDEHGHGAIAVDAGGDGRLGLCWVNDLEGPHRLMLRQPDGTWKDWATPGLAFPSRARTVVAADLDNDAHDELFLVNHGEPNRLYRLTGGCEVVMLDPGPALGSDRFGTGAAVADIDGDGVLELLVSHGEADPQPLSLYKARVEGGAGWLRVRPLTRFGAPARGAAVRLSGGGRTRVKVIDGGSGSSCQMEPVAHFGLGAGRAVESVTVTWPDGASLTMRDPDVNCTYAVPYPGG